MASVRYRKRGDSNLWTYEIRNEGKTVAHNSGFKTKKLAESEAEPILQELRLGKRISRDISLVDLYQEWLELKILPSSRSEETKKKYLLRKNTIERLFGNKKVTQIRASEYQRIMNKYGQTVGRNFLGRLNTGIHQSIQMAIADKVLIDDFTQHVELFSSKEIFTYRKGLSGFTFSSKEKIRLPTFNCSLYRLFSIKNRHEVWRVSSVNLE